MIRAVRCDERSFKTVRFGPGFNVVMADRTKESTKKDSRNGLGKSTLIEIVHFCLGGKAGGALVAEQVKGWTFSLDLTLGGRPISVSRSTGEPRRVAVEGDVSGWPVQPRADGTMAVAEWTSVLGVLTFGLPVGAAEEKYRPSFRSLISYFIRRGRDAFSSPFEHFRKQQEWDKQVCNAFLLGLSWEDARQWQLLKDRKKLVDSLKRAAQGGVLSDVLGSIGELEAVKVRLGEQANREAESLRSFRVHPNYRDIEQRANELTRQIHDAANENVSRTRLLDFYRRGLEEEREPPTAEVERVYQEAGIALPGLVLKRLDEVAGFHHQLVQNRRGFLAAEIEKLTRDAAEAQETIQKLSNERAELMVVLQTHGALEEHSRLQQLHLETTSQLRDVEARIARIKEFEAGQSELRLQMEQLHVRARQDYEERRPWRERAITLFNANSEALYHSPGNLVIDVQPTGFRFGVEIERATSEGVSSMKIFCYDLMLAQLWADRTPTPGLLVHDSTLFADVDTRQVASALERAAAESERCGFQYICALNSDTVPWTEFTAGFDLNAHVRLRLTDATDDGSLLGVRF